MRDERNHHGSRTVDPADGEAAPGATGCRSQLFGVPGIGERFCPKMPDTPSDTFVDESSVQVYDRKRILNITRSKNRVNLIGGSFFQVTLQTCKIIINL